MVEAKPDPLAHLELNSPMSLVVILLHVILSLEQALPDVGQEHVAFLELAVQSDHPCHARLIRQQCRRRSAIDHLERCRLEGGLV